MAEDTKTTLIAKLLDSLPTLLVILGVALLVLGLAGGVTYNGWLPIPDAAGRVGAATAGIAICGIGLYLSRTSKATALTSSAYGIKITHPKDGDEVEVVDVRGTIKKALPEGYSLRIFRIYPGSDRMTPIGKANVDIEKGAWEAERCHVGGKSGDKRSIAAFIVGQSGIALIDYHNEAVQTHRRTMEQLRAAGAGEGEYLPAIGSRTLDMVECHRVPIKRK